MKIELFKEITVETAEGSILYESGRQPVKSFLLQFLQMMSAILTDISENPNIKDITNTNRTLTPKLNWDLIYRPIGIRGSGDTYGIVIGTGSAAESNTDYCLASKIADGRSAGELVYSDEQYLTEIREEAGSMEWHVWRKFFNGSEGSITVNEIGIQAGGLSAGEALIIRDVLSPGVAVVVGSVFTVRYVFRTSV